MLDTLSITEIKTTTSMVPQKNSIRTNCTIIGLLSVLALLALPGLLTGQVTFYGKANFQGKVYEHPDEIEGSNILARHLLNGADYIIFKSVKVEKGNQLILYTGNKSQNPAMMMFNPNYFSYSTGYGPDYIDGGSLVLGPGEYKELPPFFHQYSRKHEGGYAGRYLFFSPDFTFYSLLKQDENSPLASIYFKFTQLDRDEKTSYKTKSVEESKYFINYGVGEYKRGNMFGPIIQQDNGRRGTYKHKDFLGATGYWYEHTSVSINGIRIPRELEILVKFSNGDKRVFRNDSNKETKYIDLSENSSFEGGKFKLGDNIVSIDVRPAKARLVRIVYEPIEGSKKVKPGTKLEIVGHIRNPGPGSSETNVQNSYTHEETITVEESSSSSTSNTFTSELTGTVAVEAGIGVKVTASASVSVGFQRAWTNEESTTHGTGNSTSLSAGAGCSKECPPGYECSVIAIGTQVSEQFYLVGHYVFLDARDKPTGQTFTRKKKVTHQNATNISCDTTAEKL